MADTYAACSTATLKNSLYDTYKMAVRWASDRIGDHGVVAFVTNGSWIDGNVDSGVRACLAEEFSSIYVVNLRGNQRTQGERSRREGGKVFGQGSRAPVAITVLVRNPDAAHNRVICVPGIGASKPFSVLVADRMPDLHFLEFGQCFPRWTYPQYPWGYL